MPSKLDLIRQYQKHRDEASFRLIYREYTPAVYHYSLRMCGSSDDASDVLQETWVRALRNLDRFEGRSAFGTWLLGICINCCREFLKRQDRWTDLPDEEPGFFPPVERKIELIDLEQALNRLPAGYRQVLLLHDFEGYKHHEIAELLEISEGTSKSQLFNARRIMRKFLQDE